MMTVRRFNSLLLLALLTVSGSSSTKVVGRAGEDVTLPCKYDFKYNGPTAVCWGRGSIPRSGCNNQIIYSDGYKVIETTRASSRYQLLGRLEDGDVSLTILKTTEEDAGLYGCRVQIYGLGNDEKHHIDLTIEKGQVTVTESVPAFSDSIDSEQQEAGRGVLVFMVRVLLAVIALATAGVATVIGRRWNQHKIPQQQQEQQEEQQQHQQEEEPEPEQMYSLIQFTSDPPAVKLQNQGPAIENIYQIDADGDAGSNSGGVYEVSP